MMSLIHVAIVPLWWQYHWLHLQDSYYKCYSIHCNLMCGLVLSINLNLQH